LGRARCVRARRWVGVGRELLEKTLCELRSRQRPICSVASQLVEQHAVLLQQVDAQRAPHLLLGRLLIIVLQEGDYLDDGPCVRHVRAIVLEDAQLLHRLVVSVLARERCTHPALPLLCSGVDLPLVLGLLCCRLQQHLSVGARLLLGGHLGLVILRLAVGLGPCCFHIFVLRGEK
jgi:hypothetical protein